ncbi:ABC transporter substrate-binding protein [Desulfococcaceae bacterium HSG9]|nr:ABC transporter substrate-binding protein [Desulfococcaceae bacterium HSG9]
MKIFKKERIILCVILMVVFAFPINTLAKEKINALYIPLADHYAAAVIAHAKYRSEMQQCNYTVEMMKSWPSLRGKFEAGQADVAYIISPMAMDMFGKKPNLRVVSLVHRDGNALAINKILEKKLNLSEKRLNRKPTADVANALEAWKKETGRPSICAVPSLLATHTVVMYKYLKDHGKTLAIGSGDGDVLAKAVAPPLSPVFLKQQAKAGKAACFEQSLPWADIVETDGFGKVAWYSKDVIQSKHGHVECIMIASDNAIKNKKEALKELVYYIHKAGREIDSARAEGGQALRDIATIVSEYIPSHNIESVIQSLRADIAVINYSNLNVDKPGLKQIMDLAVESKILKKAIDINAFADETFSVDAIGIE